MKEYIISYETTKCKNCNKVILADSESEAWSKFVLFNIGKKYRKFRIKERQTNE